MTILSQQMQHSTCRFDKIDGFIRTNDGTRFLRLFRSEKYDAIYERIRHLISLKSGITYISPLYFAKIKVGSYDPSL